MKTICSVIVACIFCVCCSERSNYTGHKYKVTQVSNALGDTLYEVQVYFTMYSDDNFICDGYKDYSGIHGPKRYTKPVADSICKVLNDRDDLKNKQEFHE